MIRTASSTAHSSCGLTTKPRNFVSMSRLSTVSVIRPPVAGTRLTQTSTFTETPLAPDALVGRVEQRRAARDGDRHRVPLPKVLNGERRPDDSVFGRQV